MAILAISVDTLAGAVQMDELTHASYPIMADPNAQVARSYGVYDLLDDGVAAPATFIIAQDGTIVWLHVGVNVGDRPNTLALLATVRDLLEPS